MKNILNNIYKRYGIVVVLLVASTFIAHAQITVTGVITDENNTPMPGAEIMIKGTTQGTLTNTEGEYSIEVPDGESVLVFRFVGYSPQEITVGEQTAISLQMSPDIQALDQVVVVGYGTQRKRDITGSVAVVEMESFDKSHYTTITDRLQGRVAGVTVTTTGEPGGMGDIVIRGNNFFDDNQPIYVVDGIITQDSPGLNPNDIESIQVLKDASSAAIYGNKSANGVVVITTKKGSAGKPEVSFSANFGLQQLPSNVDVTDNQGWARIQNAARDNADQTRDIYANNVPDINTDWQKEVFNENALIQDLNLSVSGGGENSRVFFSVNNAYQEGIIKGPLFDRTSLRLNSDFKIGKRITVGENLTGSYRRTIGLPGYFGGDSNPIEEIVGNLPVIPVYDPAKPSGYGYGELGVVTTTYLPLAE